MTHLEQLKAMLKDAKIRHHCKWDMVQQMYRVHWLSYESKTRFIFYFSASGYLKITSERPA
jgi:hypothetical protein